MYIVIDIETGGFSKKKNGICEIAWVLMDSSFNITDKFSILIKPYPRCKDVQEFDGQLVSYKEDAMNVHGITLEELESEGVDRSEFASIFESSCSLLLNKQDKPTKLVGHNLEGFDYPWLHSFMGEMYEFESAMDLFPHDLRIDTLRIAREKRGKGSKNDLETLCQEFNIENPDSHRALGDALSTARLLPILLELD